VFGRHHLLEAEQPLGMVAAGMSETKVTTTVPPATKSSIAARTCA
jgi:hypothetical protein